MNSELGVHAWFDRAIVGNNAAESFVKVIQLVKKIPRVVLPSCEESIVIQQDTFPCVLQNITTKSITNSQSV